MPDHNAGIALLALTAATAPMPIKTEISPALIGAGAADISGEWNFATGDYAGACRMSGQMSIGKAQDGGRHDCTFVTSEHCGNGYSASVRQSCVASRSGDELVITSVITDIVQMTPKRYGYAPDHWTLRIKSAREMTGSLISAHNAPALFTRDPAPVS